MGKFATPKWDSTDVGDKICDALFKGKNKTKNKEKIRNGGRIIKAKVNKAKTEINEKLVKNIGNNLKNVKNAINDSKNKILKKHKSNRKANSSIENEMDTSQQKLIKKIKKVPKCNLPSFKQLKNIVETKLSKDDDEKMLFAEDPDNSISENPAVVTPKRKRKKKKKMEDLKKDLSEKIETNIVKTKNKLKKRKKKLQLEDNGDQNNLDDSLDSRNNSVVVEKKIKKDYKNSSLRERMMAKLKSSRFRYLNEQLYVSPGNEAKSLFESDPDAFKAYHDGFRQQVEKWPVNPVDVIIKSIKNMKKSFEIADFGCGEAKIAQEVKQKVHSFDLLATNERVTACDMANVPLPKESVDVAVFCLSLMGTNLQDYLKEANRVLKTGGILKIAEVESRFDNVDEFIKGVQHFGFQNIHKDLTHNLFYFMDFKKISNVKKTKGLPTLSLNPCLYKKR